MGWPGILLDGREYYGVTGYIIGWLSIMGWLGVLWDVSAAACGLLYAVHTSAMCREWEFGFGASSSSSSSSSSVQHNID